jgi:adenylyl-sulfate kinase
MPALAELTDYSLAVGSLSEGWLPGIDAAPQPLDHSGMTVWFTGLSGSGKSTISQAVHRELAASGHRVDLLDGDEVRLFLSRDLTFSKQDRDENVRRIGYVAELLTRNGVITLVSAISPYRDARESVRRRIPAFLEVYVNASIEECERRDVKGLYKRARAGHIQAFTGISDPYEAPPQPDLECRTDLESVTESVQKVVRAIASRLRVKGSQPSSPRLR